MTTRTADHRALLNKIKAMEPQGWSYKTTKAGVVIHAPNERGTVSLHASGASDYRTMTNTLAELRRLGFEDDLAAAEKEKAGKKRIRLAADRAGVDTDTTAPVPADTAATWFSAGSDEVPRPSQTRGMLSRTEQISPERAAELCARPFTAALPDGTRLRQRRLDTKHVQWLVRIIQDGEWKTLPGGISFAPDGSCLDGQHRLHAIHQAGLPPDGQPVTVRVHYNVDPEFFAAMDTNKTRSAADALYIEGLNTAGTLVAASTLKLLTCYRAYLDGAENIPAWPSWGSWKISNDAVVRAAHDFPTLGEHIRVAHNMAARANLVAASLAAFRQIAVNAWPDGTDVLENFCVDLRPDRADRVLTKGNPALTLRNHVMRIPKGTMRPRREVLLFLLLKHWNAYAGDKSIGAVNWDTTDQMPTPFQPGRRRARKAA